MTAALLTLAQWTSPAFPLGAFAYSGGLETALASGRVASEADVSAWVLAGLEAGAGWSDAVVLAEALRGGAPAELADLCAALAPGAERWAETRDQGAAFAATLGRAPGPLPVVFGAAARDLGLPPETVIAFYLQSLAAAQVSVAVRTMPLGQVAGQRVLTTLGPRIAALAEAAAKTPLHALGTATLAADLAGLLHETLDVRLYRS